MSVIDLVERLTRKVQKLPAMGGGSIGLDANGKTTVTSDGYRLANPDGPEAADTITRLQAALDEIAGAPLYRTRTGNGRVCLAEHTRDIARKAVGGE